MLPERRSGLRPTKQITFTGTTIFVDGGMSLYPEFRDNG